MPDRRTRTALLSSAALTLLAYGTPWLLAGWVSGDPIDGYALGGDVERPAVYLPAPAPQLEVEASDEPTAEATDEAPSPPRVASKTPSTPASPALAAPVGTAIPAAPNAVAPDTQLALHPHTKDPLARDPRLRSSMIRAAARRPSTKKKRRKRCSKEWSEIRQTGDFSYEIEEALVDHYTANLDTFLQLGWSKPYETADGERGWYVSGFSCNSPLYAGGLRRGDVLLTVNGKKTRTWVQVYFLYQRLKHKDTFEIELLRKGEPVTLDVRLIDPTADDEPTPKRKRRRRKKRRDR